MLSDNRFVLIIIGGETLIYGGLFTILYLAFLLNYQLGLVTFFILLRKMKLMPGHRQNIRPLENKINWPSILKGDWILN